MKRREFFKKLGAYFLVLIPLKTFESPKKELDQPGKDYDPLEDLHIREISPEKTEYPLSACFCYCRCQRSYTKSQVGSGVSSRNSAAAPKPKSRPRPKPCICRCHVGSPSSSLRGAIGDQNRF
jgi:hypothetical protein